MERRDQELACIWSFSRHWQRKLLEGKHS